MCAHFPSLSAVEHARATQAAFTVVQPVKTKTVATPHPRHKRTQWSATAHCLSVVSQNVRGFAKGAKSVEEWFGGLRTRQKGKVPDVTFIQETRAHSEWASRLDKEYTKAWGQVPGGPGPSLSYWQSTTSASGGVAILLKPDSAVTNVQPLWRQNWNDHFMAVTGEYDGQRVSLVNVYAPSAKREREHLFANLKTLGCPPGLIFLGGDFNCVLDPELDRSRLSLHDTGSSELVALLTAWRLSDASTLDQLAIETETDKLDYYASQHTYRYRVNSDGVASSRIDRWYVPTSALGRVARVAVTTPVCSSDHDAVHLAFLERHPPHAPVKTRGRRAIRYPLDPGTDDIVNELTLRMFEEFEASIMYDRPEEYGNAWDATKVTIRTRILSSLRLWRSKRTRAYRQRIRRLRTQLRLAQTVTTDGRTSIAPTIAGITNGLENLSLHRYDRQQRIRDELINVSRAHSARRRTVTFSLYAGTGTDAQRAFYRRIAMKFQRRRTVRLPWIRGAPRNPSERMAKDWRGVTQRGPMDPGLQDAFFRRLPPPTRKADPAGLTDAFTVEEVRAAIQACPRGKASGPDGIPNDWYRDHCDLVAPVLAKLFSAWLSAACVPKSFRGATIFCIPKKANVRTGLDFRPIALLNTDYKIYSRLLLERMKQQLPRLVSPAQFGFVQGRQAHDAIDVWTAAQALVANDQAPSTALAVLIDFAKAYDTLDRRFLSLALRRLGFPSAYVAAVDDMHLATTAAFLAEDHISKDHAVLNGIRQGCPFAPVLFILAVDTLYAMIHADDAIVGLTLPTGEQVTVTGFADDTTIYLAHPRSTAALHSRLTQFAMVSGLCVNVDKSHAVALHDDGWTDSSCEIPFPKLPRDQLARLLGAQIASRLNQARVWDLTEEQLRSRLYLAEVKTTDVLQRVMVARAIIVPKLLYIGRHVWPNASRIKCLQRHLHNYVWHGRYGELRAPRKAWMSAVAAALPLREGGLGIPQLANEFKQLATKTTLRWSQRDAGLRSAIGAVLLSQARATISPTRAPTISPRLRQSLATTGVAIETGIISQPRTSTETEQVRDLLRSGVGRGTRTDKRWNKDWLYCNYNSRRPALMALRTHQSATHGSFDTRGLWNAPVTGQDILLVPGDRQARVSDFPGLVNPGDTISDVLECERAGRDVVRFRAKRIPFPLAPTAVASFRKLCDVLVFNYPALLAPQDPVDVIQVFPPSEDVWRLRRTADGLVMLVWEPTPVYQHDMQLVSSSRDVTAIVRQATDNPSARAQHHPWFDRTRFIWRPRTRLLSAAAIKKCVREPGDKRGRIEVQASSGSNGVSDSVVASALAGISWRAIDRLQASTSGQRLLVRRLKAGKLSGWDRLHERHGCPHCPWAAGGGSIDHIFWECPQAQALWRLVRAGWKHHEIWGAAGIDTFENSVFSLTLPHFPSELWDHPELRAIPRTDSVPVEAVHATARVAWQQQVITTLSIIWRWRNNVDGGEQHWSRPTAQHILAGSLRASTAGLLQRLPAGPALRDPRRGLLSELARPYADDSPAPTLPARLTPTTVPSDQHILFFDGGSRGNPGPGGAGAVIVRWAADTARASVVWSACMSYAQPDMTNNRAEYLGAIAGLQAALEHGWRVEVVGDSALILGQLRRYAPPKNAALRPLYAIARRLADQVGVRVWRHHLRAYNKMADAAANVAMDQRRSLQALHTTRRPYMESIERHLAQDYQEWQNSRLLRLTESGG